MSVSDIQVIQGEHENAEAGPSWCVVYEDLVAPAPSVAPSVRAVSPSPPLHNCCKILSNWSVVNEEGCSRIFHCSILEGGRYCIMMMLDHNVEIIWVENRT